MLPQQQGPRQGVTVCPRNIAHASKTAHALPLKCSCKALLPAKHARRQPTQRSTNNSQVHCSIAPQSRAPQTIKHLVVRNSAYQPTQISIHASHMRGRLKHGSSCVPLAYLTHKLAMLASSTSLCHSLCIQLLACLRWAAKHFGRTTKHAHSLQSPTAHHAGQHMLHHKVYPATPSSGRIRAAIL